jgi:quercetin dioxygenase-like cupin family protein
MHFTHLQIGEAFAILYRFDKKGDGIPMHEHPPHLEHDIACTRGSVRVHGPKWEQHLLAGRILHFDSSQPHEIEALEDNSSVLNTFLQGRPREYANLPAHEIDGSVMLPLLEPLKTGD